jgi:ATP-dependent protease ClpP protease subunit
VFRIASHGGRTEALKLVLDAILRFKGRSIAIVDFFALSASADIACACDRVVMRAGSVMKLHATSITTVGTANHLGPLALELRSLDDAFAARISRKRRVPLDAVRDLISRDRYVAADEAHALGLCDAITRPLDGAAETISKEIPDARA